MHSIRGLQLTTFSLLVPFQMTESQLKDLKNMCGNFWESWPVIYNLTWLSYFGQYKQFHFQNHGYRSTVLFPVHKETL